MKNRKFASLLLSASLLALALTACGGSGSSSGKSSNSSDSNNSSNGNGSSQESNSAEAGKTEAASSSEKSGEPVTVKLGVVGSIYEELWTPAKEALKSEGIDLEFVQFSDYVTPNNALANGEIDLNGFQHQIFLESDIESNGYKIQNIGNTFIIPLNLYSGKVKSVEELKDGDTVAIPNDVTNGGRALKVLEAAGLIRVKPEAGFNPTIDDVEAYNVNIKIQELAANTIPSALADVTAGIVNGNYALDFGLKTEEAIFKDTSLDEQKYWNLVAARTDDLSDPEKKETYRKVIEAFQSPETEKVFNDTFGGYFIKEGWDEDLLSK